MTVDPNCWTETLAPGSLAQPVPKAHGVYTIATGVTDPSTLPKTAGTSDVDVDALTGVPAVADRVTGDVVVAQYTPAAPVGAGARTAYVWVWDGDTNAWVQTSRYHPAKFA